MQFFCFRLPIRLLVVGLVFISTSLSVVNGTIVPVQDEILADVEQVNRCTQGEIICGSNCCFNGQTSCTGDDLTCEGFFMHCETGNFPWQLCGLNCCQVGAPCYACNNGCCPVGGYNCFGGACVTGGTTCTTNANCPTGTECVQGLGLCLAPGPSCATGYINIIPAGNHCLF